MEKWKFNEEKLILELETGKVPYWVDLEEIRSLEGLRSWLDHMRVKDCWNNLLQVKFCEAFDAACQKIFGNCAATIFNSLGPGDSLDWKAGKIITKGGQ